MFHVKHYITLQLRGGCIERKPAGGQLHRQEAVGPRPVRAQGNFQMFVAKVGSKISQEKIAILLMIANVDTDVKNETDRICNTAIQSNNFLRLFFP